MEPRPKPGALTIMNALDNSTMKMQDTRANARSSGRRRA
jgi:hypothetical protein